VKIKSFNFINLLTVHDLFVRLTIIRSLFPESLGEINWLISDLRPILLIPSIVHGDFCLHVQIILVVHDLVKLIYTEVSVTRNHRRSTWSLKSGFGNAHHPTNAILKPTQRSLATPSVQIIIVWISFHNWRCTILFDYFCKCIGAMWFNWYFDAWKSEKSILNYFKNLFQLFIHCFSTFKKGRIHIFDFETSKSLDMTKNF